MFVKMLLGVRKMDRTFEHIELWSLACRGSSGLAHLRLPVTCHFLSDAQLSNNNGEAE